MWLKVVERGNRSHSSWKHTEGFFIPVFRSEPATPAARCTPRLKHNIAAFVDLPLKLQSVNGGGNEPAGQYTPQVGHLFLMALRRVSKGGFLMAEHQGLTHGFLLLKSQLVSLLSWKG